MFNKWLSQPIKEEHKDPLWATASIISILTFSSSDASSPGEAWPLGAPNGSDLEWLRLAHGKMKLWHLVNPLRPESVFRTLSDTFTSMLQPLPIRGIEGMPADLAELCGLDDTSTRDSSPFFRVAHAVSQLLEMPRGEESEGKVLLVSSHMDQEFGLYLDKKDPVALLLLCFWYARARDNRWWINLRATYELPAICAYLHERHKNNTPLQALIPWDDARDVIRQQPSINEIKDAL